MDLNAVAIRVAAALTPMQVFGLIVQAASDDLSYLPDAAKAAEARGMSPDEFKQAVLRLSDDGWIELRPDSGIELLTAEGRKWCPTLNLPWSKPVYLSMVRLISD